MFEISDRSTDTCLVVTVQGAVTGEDYEGFLDAFDRRVEANGFIDLVVALPGAVRYGDGEAFKDDWKFAFRQYHEARRAAFVGERHVINAMLRVFGLLTRTEERIFGSEQLDEAIAWACGAGGS